MAKGKKRKNPGVGVDFRKVKHKVGKKLPKAQNDTRTDFQARSINLPNQSITQDKSGAAVSERNLTLTELLSQLSHHNSGTRRDALVGLQQLATTHPSDARRQAALLLEALSGRLSDGEASVRAALLNTLRCAVLPALGPSGVRPFLPLLLAHLTAALTHLSADVRFDALAVLEALTQQAPELMAQQAHLGEVLGHYNGLLSRANRGKSVRNQALAGLLRVVSSLDKFLQTAVGASSSTGSTGGQAAAAAAGGGNGAGALGGQEGGEGLSVGGTRSEGALLMCLRVAPAPAAAAQLPDVDCLLQLYCPAALAVTAKGTSKGSAQKQQQQQEPAAGVNGSTAGSSGGQQLQQQVLVLLTSLYDCWSEAAPGSLSTTPDAESAQVLVHILAATDLLLACVNPQHSPNAAAQAAAANAHLAMSLPTYRSSNVCDWSGKGLGFDSRRDQNDWAEAAASIVFPKLTKVFPVAPEAPERLSPALQDLLQTFNLLGMQLCSRLMAAGVTWPQQQQRQRLQGQQWQQQRQQGGGHLAAGCVSNDGVLQDWQQQLLIYMAGVLSAGNCLPSLHHNACSGAKRSPAISSSSSKQQQQHKVQGAASGGISSSSSSLSSSAVMVTVLQSLQQLLPFLRQQHLQNVLAAISQVAAAADPSRPSPVSHTTSTSVTAGAAAAADCGGVRDGGGAAHGGGRNIINNSSSSATTTSSSMLMPLSSATRGAAASNAVRTAGLRLQLLLLQQHLAHVAPDALEEAAVLSWLAAAPRQLYQLGASKPKISQLLLQLLFEAARLSVPGSPIADQLQDITPQLAALLVTALPNQQTQQPKDKAANTTPPSNQAAAAAAAAIASAAPPPAACLVIGPISDLPPACQHLFFDTLAHLPQLTSHILKAVALACRVTSYSHTAVQRLLDGLLATAGSSMPPDLYASLLVTLMSPGPFGGYVHRRNKRPLYAGFDRHQLVVDAVCRWLHSYGPVREVLELLTGPLLQQWQQQHTPGTTAAAAAAAGRCWTQQQQQQHVCCLAYSLLALAALSVGCWRPSAGTAARNTAAVAAVGRGGPGGKACAATAQAAASCVPAGLLSVLPSVLVAYCLCCKGVAGTDAGGVEAAGNACLQQLVLPLGVALPLTTLLLPFLQELVQLGAQQQQQEKEKERTVLHVLVHVLSVLLGCQALRHGWVEHQQLLQTLLQQCEVWAQQVDTQHGGGSMMAKVQQLQTSLAVMCSE